MGFLIITTVFMYQFEIYIIHAKEDVYMPSIQDQHTAAFVSINKGTIRNCCATIRYTNNVKSNIFCHLNQGTIENAICVYASRRNIKTVPAFSSNTDGISNCFVLPYKSKEKQKIAFQGLEASSEWIYDPDTMDYPTLKIDLTPRATEQENTIIISTTEELLQLAEQVNSGDLKAASASYILANHLDLKGKSWTPIGLNDLTPFTGSFNGNGYSITNFVINNKSFENAGLFGFLRNATVQNLSVDCEIKTGIYAGSIAGVCEEGTIRNCTAISLIYGARYIGGIVGKNTGIIEGCNYRGTLRRLVLLPAIWLCIIPLFFVITTAYANTYIAPMLHKDSSNPSKGQSALASYFPAVKVDTNSKKLANDEEEAFTGGNSVSFTFLTKLTAKNGTSEAELSFENPSRSNHSIKVQIHITDQELIDMIGYTGRTAEEQAILQADERYSPETSRIIVAESGIVMPGYGIDKIQLTTLPDGSALPKGIYNAVLYMNFYDITTNEMAMVNSQSPVVLVVEN